MEEINVAVIGIGKMAQTKYLPILQKIKNVKTTVICDRSHTLVQKVVKKLSLPESSIAYSVDDVCNQNVNIAFVLTHDHFDITQKLLHAGISVCVEKPLCWDSKQTEQLQAIASASNANLYATYMKQYDASFSRFLQEIAQRGKPQCCRVYCYAGNNKRWCDRQYDINKESADEKKITTYDINNRWNDFFAGRGVMSENDKSVYRLLLQLGIHQLNLIQVVLGLVVPVYTTAIGNTINAEFIVNGCPVSYTLSPTFSAPWLWKEGYEVLYPDAVIQYIPGSPFLNCNESYLNVLEDRGGESFASVRSETVDPFENMLYDLINKAWHHQPDKSVEEAIADIRLIEQMMEQIMVGHCYE